MQIVIDIDEKLYYRIKSYDVKVVDNIPMASAINNGTPLPKGHGRLIDADKLCQTPIDGTDIPSDGLCLMVYDLGEIENAPTIIGADKAESEEKE